MASGALPDAVGHRTRAQLSADYPTDVGLFDRSIPFGACDGEGSARRKVDNQDFLNADRPALRMCSDDNREGHAERGGWHGVRPWTFGSRF